MSDEGEGILYAGIVLGIFVGSLAASAITSYSWKQEAVQHGAAHYDAKTAAFTWNDEVKP